MLQNRPWARNTSSERLWPILAGFHGLDPCATRGLEYCGRGAAAIFQTSCCAGTKNGLMVVALPLSHCSRDTSGGEIVPEFVQAEEFPSAGDILEVVLGYVRELRLQLFLGEAL